MPANLTPQYMAADEKFRAARTPEEKLGALEEMLATIPKHKGTEKMQADIKRRIKKLREDNQKKHGKSQFSYHIEKEGAAQVVIAGAPNSGKSALLTSLTNAVSEVADYPYTTRKAIPGMMQFENIQIQIVDTPAISDEFMETWLPGIIRNSDGLIITVDTLSDDSMEQLEMVLGRLESSRLKPVRTPEVEEPGQALAQKRTLIAGTKGDSDESRENFSVLKELFGERLPMLIVSVNDQESLDAFKREVFIWLEILRVYTKIPGGRPDFSHPFILKKGSTVLDVARSVHKELYEKFKYARIWGSGRYEGQMVQKDYVVLDGDIIEVHTQ